jgi:thiamine-monophosphate kinase
MLRSAAKPGDRIYVTGELGASAQGFSNQQGKNFRRHLRPEPRIDTGAALRRLGVKAAMDLSDGLSLDLRRMCLESKVSAEIDSDPPGARGASLDDALHGGEDYELLFTAPRRLLVPKKLGSLAITPIGTITAGQAGRVRFRGRLLNPKGFDHFE